MPAIQTCFSTPQITSNIKKWPKSVPNEVPKIRQKSSKIHLGTLKGPPERTLVPNGHQTDAKMLPQDPQNAPKIVSRDASKSLNVHALLHEPHGKWFRWLNANLPGNNGQLYRFKPGKLSKSIRVDVICTKLIVNDFADWMHISQMFSVPPAGRGETPKVVTPKAPKSDSNDSQKWPQSQQMGFVKTCVLL